MGKMLSLHKQQIQSGTDHISAVHLPFKQA